MWYFPRIFKSIIFGFGAKFKFLTVKMSQFEKIEVFFGNVVKIQTPQNQQTTFKEFKKTQREFADII